MGNIQRQANILAPTEQQRQIAKAAAAEDLSYYSTVSENLTKSYNAALEELQNPGEKTREQLQAVRKELYSLEGNLRILRSYKNLMGDDAGELGIQLDAADAGYKEMKNAYDGYYAKYASPEITKTGYGTNVGLTVKDNATGANLMSNAATGMPGTGENLANIAEENNEWVRRMQVLDGKTYTQIRQTITDLADEADQMSEGTKKTELLADIDFYEEYLRSGTADGTMTAEDATYDKMLNSMWQNDAQEEMEENAGEITTDAYVSYTGQDRTRQHNSQYEQAAAKDALFQSRIGTLEQQEFDKEWEEKTAQLDQLSLTALKNLTDMIDLKNSYASARGSYGASTIGDPLAEKYAEVTRAIQVVEDRLRSAGYTDEDIVNAEEWARRQRDAEQTENTVAQAEENYEERSKFASYLDTLANGMASGVGYLDMVGQKVNKAATGTDAPLNYNTTWQQPYYRYTKTVELRTADLVEKYGEDTGAVLAGLYNLGVSMGESAVVVGLTAMGVPAALVLLGGSAATSTAMEYHEQGYSDDTALWMGFAAGAAEIITEKVSLDHLFALKDVSGVMNTLKHIGMQGVIEGSEEVASDILNAIADSVANGKYSELQGQVNALVRSGMTREQATAKAWQDWCVQAAKDFLGGTVSGLVFAGGGTAVNSAANAVEQNAMAKNIYGASIDQLVEESLELEPGNRKAIGIQQKLEAGKQVMGSEIRALVEQNEKAIQRTSETDDEGEMESGGESESVREEDELNEEMNEKLKAWEEQKKTLDSDNTPVSQKIMSAQMEQEQNAEDAAAGPEEQLQTDSAAAILRQEVEEITATDGMTEEEAMYKWDDDYHRVTVAMNNALVAGDEETADIYERLEEAMGNAIAETGMTDMNAMKAYVKGAINGTGIYDGNGQRDAGESAGEQTGELRPVSEGDSGDEAIRGADGEAFESAESLGIPNGASERINRVVAENEWKPAMKKAADEAAEMGYEVKYVTGPIRVIRPETGEILNMTGVIYGENIVVRSDSRLYRPEALARHELLHAKLERDSAMYDEIFDALVEKLGWEKIQNIMSKYAAGYNFVYGEANESMTADEVAELDKMYMTEFMCDAYGGISRSFMGNEAEQVAEEVREIAAARQGYGAGSGGMPGVRYSEDEQLEEEPIYGIRSSIPGLTAADREYEARLAKAKIKPDMDEEKRAEILEHKKITAPAYDGHDTVTEREIEELQSMYLKDAKKIIKNIAERCGVIRSGYTNKDVGIEFSYSKRAQKESMDKQTSRGENAENFGKMLTVLPDVIDGAVEVEAHTDKYKGTRRENIDFKEMHVLLGAFVNGSDIIPVQLEIKEYKPEARTENKLYVVVTMKENEAGITPRPTEPTMEPHSHGTPASEVTLPSVIENVNDETGGLLKYIPDVMLTVEQIETKKKAIEKDNKWLGDMRYEYAMERGDSETAERMLGERAKKAGYKHAEEEGKKTGVTYDDSGEVIPLSKRYDAKNSDVRYSVDDEFDIEGATRAQLWKQIKKDRRTLSAFAILSKRGKLDKELKAERADVKKRIGTAQEKLQEMGNISEEEKDAAEKKKIEPTIAKSDFRKQMMELYYTPEGQRGEMGKLLDRFAERCMEKGSIDNADLDALTDQLFERGVVRVDADEADKAVRDSIAGRKIYVDEATRNEFGDDYDAIRKRAFIAGVYLTSDKRENHIEQIYSELEHSFSGMFRGGDDRQMLVQIIEAAEEGKAENVSMEEMMERTRKIEGISVDDQLYELEQKTRNVAQKFVEKAGIETALRKRSATEIGQVMEKHKKAVQKQRDQRALGEMQQNTMRALKWLSKNEDKAPADLKERFEETLGDIDLYAISTANEMRYSDKYKMTWRDLADVYTRAKKEDPNFFPSKELERIMARLDKDKIGEMDVEALNDLYRAAVQLRQEFYDRNNIIGDEEHALFSQAYEEAVQEIKQSGGKGGFGGVLGKFYNIEQMTPLNVMEMMGGWKPNGTWFSFAKNLERGERNAKAYEVDAKGLLEAFTKENADWIKTADGQGKNAVWYEIEVPELMELHMGDKPIFGETKTVYMTPAQKVHMYLESRNYQNLRHMAGGRTFVNKELYAKGKTGEAYAQGTTIRMAPETVKRIVSDLTTEELELAGILEKYYNGFAAERINKTSNVLYGFDKAVSNNYAPIFSNKNYNKSEPGIYDVTAEGVSHMKGRVNYAANPSYNISAFDAFDKHVGQTARFVGYSVPIRNMNRIMNWQSGDTNMKDQISRVWGKAGVDYINDLMTKLQNPEFQKKSLIEGMGGKILSNHISGVFGANMGIVLKQAASYPAAGAVLGFDTLPTPGQVKRTDDALIRKYTPELEYRRLGYATPEVAELKKNPSKMDTNKVTKFLFRGGAITAMDAATVRAIWTWAENYVRKNNPDLEVGTAEMIEAGMSPFYQKVAEMFNLAVNTTQPMYDTMHRAQIMDNKNDLVRTFTLFKTVPLQEYNTLRKYLGEAKNASGKKKKEARRKASDTIVSILLSTMSLDAIEFLIALLLNKGKRYRDEDGELTIKSVALGFIQDVVCDLAGVTIGGSEIAEAILGVIQGDGIGDVEVVGGTQINDIIDALESVGEGFAELVKDLVNLLNNGGSVDEYRKLHGGDILGAVESMAETVAQYAAGFPLTNIRKYLLGVTSWMSPEIATAYEDLVDTPTKSDLSGLEGEQLERRIGDMMYIRGVDTSEHTERELARLYAEGEKAAIPYDPPTSFSVGEETWIVSATDEQKYVAAYKEVLESIDELLVSSAYTEAGDEAKAKMIAKLYSYADAMGKKSITEEYEPAEWVTQATAASEDGVPLEAYIALKASGLTKTAEQVDAIDGMDITDSQKGKLYYYAVASDNEIAYIDSQIDDGAQWSEVFDEKRGTGLVALGLDKEDAQGIYAAWAELVPEDGKSSVTTAQKAEVVARSDLSADEMVDAMGVVLGTETTTESGNPTSYGNLIEVAQTGLDMESWVDLYATGQVDVYLDMYDAGMSNQTAKAAALALAEIEPEPGEESVSALQKMNAVMKGVSGNGNQISALTAILNDTQAQKLEQASAYGLTAQTYVNYRNTVENYYGYETGKSDTSLSQAEVTAALNSMNLTNTERAVLWQIQTMGKDGANNPYDTGIGKAIYDRYQAWKEAQG